MWTDEARARYKDDGRRYPSDLTDAEWRTIEPVLRSYVTLMVDLCEMVNACLYFEKAGCPWRFLPKEFGPWQTVRAWHDRFRADGLWPDIAALLTRAVRARQGRKPEPATAIPAKPLGLRRDSQSVPSRPQARRNAQRLRLGPRGVDGNKKVRGIKRHVLTCSLGFVLAVLVTAANAHDTQPVGAAQIACDFAALLARAVGPSSASRSTASMWAHPSRRRHRTTAWTSRSRPATRT